MLRFENFSKIKNILSDARRRFVTHMAVLACGGSSVNNCVPKAKSSWKFGLVGKDHMNFFLSLEMLHVCSHAVFSPAHPLEELGPGFSAAAKKSPAHPLGGNLERRGWAGVVRGAGKGKRPGDNPVPRGRRGGKKRYGCIFL